MELLFENVTRTTASTLLYKGDSMKWRRVFEDGFVTIENKGSAQCKVTVLWLNDIHTYDGESQFQLELAPGTSIEFEPPQNLSANQFLDTVIIDLVSEGCLEVSSMMPLEVLN